MTRRSWALLLLASACAPGPTAAPCLTAADCASGEACTGGRCGPGDAGPPDTGCATSTLFVDEDGDGFGTDETIIACVGAPGVAERSGDCDDTLGSVHPGAVELCDGLSNTCSSTDACAPGCTGDTFLGHAYAFCDGTPDFVTADTICAGMGHGGRLVQVDSVEENDYLRDFANRHGLSTRRIWIGLTDVALDGAWTWTTGAALGSYHPWAAGEPMGGVIENCARLRPSGEWSDDDCHELGAYVCETVL